MSDKPAIKIGYEEPKESTASTAPSLAALQGVFRIVDTEPTWTPRGRFEDSIALLIDGGTPNLCVYDYTNAQWLFSELSPTRIP